MPIRPVSLLIVDNDDPLTRRVDAAAVARGYRVDFATSLAAVNSALACGAVDVALVDLAVAGESGFDVIRRIKEQTPDAEIVVLSAGSSLASAIHSYELSAFAFVQKPFDVDQLFATIERALERRQMNLDNQRLVWELQTINQIADGIARSLELDDVLAGALQCTVGALGVLGGSIRLREEATGLFIEKAFVGPSSMHDVWTRLQDKGLPPSERVIRTRMPLIVDDLRTLLPSSEAQAVLPLSTLTVPILAGDELLGTMTVGAERPGRFELADQRLLGVIAGQIGVAVQNARLHDFVRRGKRDWEQTFDAIADPIAVFDSHGALLRGNKALASHLSRDVTTLRGATCREVGFCNGTGPACVIARAVAQDASQSEVTLADGQIFSVTTFPVVDGRNGASVVQVAKNVTEDIRGKRRLEQMSDELALANARSMAALDRLKSTQAQLLQAEKLSAIGQLVAGVAHELNNPLTSVIGYAQLLEEELQTSDATGGGAQLAQDLRRIAQESERAAKIVRNLLAFARRQSAERAPQDVADLFSRVMALRSYELRLNGIELVTEFQPALPSVIVDGSQLQQALLNLVLNAEQAMRGRSTKRLHVGARFDTNAGAVELFVNDTGHGIDRANLSRIFDPFFTTRDVGEGTGLGLSICYGIIRDHGGQITVESVVNTGTTFSVLLPARIDEVVATDPVLIAHAEQGERDYLAAALNGWGSRIITAATSSEALDIYRRRSIQAAFVERGLVAADVAAWQSVCEELGVPLVLVSMSADDGDVERFGREYASAVLSPPFQLRAIRSAVRAIAKECV
jgi:signal transduction histidine kinase/DNA-binding response OmpR family regulator